MFALSKRNATKVKSKLEQDYQDKFNAARQAQRNGNIDTYSQLTTQAKEIAEQIHNLRGYGRSSIRH